MTRIENLFAEFGIVVPSTHDGACFRCGKPKHVRGDKEGLCIDCHDECEYLGSGFEASVRSELRAGRWRLQSGLNHWRGSLLPSVHRVILDAMGVDPGELGERPVAVYDAINQARPSADRSDAARQPGTSDHLWRIRVLVVLVVLVILGVVCF